MANVIFLTHIRQQRNRQQVSLSLVCEQAVSQRLALSAMLASLDNPDNQRRFLAFPEGYCWSHKLALEQIHAITDLDVLMMLRLGAAVADVQLLAGLYGLDLADLCEQQHGKTLEEVRQLLQGCSNPV